MIHLLHTMCPKCPLGGAARVSMVSSIKSEKKIPTETHTTNRMGFSLTETHRPPVGCRFGRSSRRGGRLPARRGGRSGDPPVTVARLPAAENPAGPTLRAGQARIPKSRFSIKSTGFLTGSRHPVRSKPRDVTFHRPAS